MSATAHRIIQVVLLAFCVFALLGGGVFHQQVLADNVVRTATLTAYKALPQPPRGPDFCRIVTVGDYGVVWPCDYRPPFIWWLRHRAD